MTLLIVFWSVQSSLVSASTIQGGQMIINFDRDALAGAFTHDNDPSRPAFYVEEFFDASAAAIRTGGQILSEHIVPGAGEITATGLQFQINGTTVNNLPRRENQPTTLQFDPADLTGTVQGAIGLTGLVRYRLDIPFRVSPTGEEEGNRIVSGDYSLQFDKNRVTEAHSGWYLLNHYGFLSNTYDLDNVLSIISGNTLTLSGDIAFAEGTSHFGAQLGAVVGDFTLQTTVVPLPAAVWFLFTGLASLSVFRGRKNELS